MHKSKKELQSITKSQVDTLYNLLVEVFPAKAGDFKQTMDSCDKDNVPNDVAWKHLWHAAYDWILYGN